jgi:hypothetical protein
MKKLDEGYIIIWIDEIRRSDVMIGLNSAFWLEAHKFKRRFVKFFNFCDIVLFKHNFLISERIEEPKEFKRYPWNYPI